VPLIKALEPVSIQPVCVTAKVAVPLKLVLPITLKLSAELL